MKEKILYSALVAAIVLPLSCQKDDILDYSGTGASGLEENTSEVDDEQSVSDVEWNASIGIVFSNSGAATVTGDTKGIVSVSGNDVTVNNATGEKITYTLSGETSDGFFKVYSDTKQAIVLDGVSITNKRGAAINNQGKKTCYIQVQGTNKLADGTSYTLTPSTEDEKAVLFSEGQLVFSGSGSLLVTASGKSGITSDDYIVFENAPSIQVVSSSGHGIRGKEYINVNGGSIDVTLTSAAVGKKGFCSDSLIVFHGGETVISSAAPAGTVDGSLTGAAGIKADQVFRMEGGSLTVLCSGKGSKGIKSGDEDEGYSGAMRFAGGSVNVTCTGANYGTSSGWGSSSSDSKSAKGIKCDGNIVFCGSEVSVSCSGHEAIEAKGTMDVSGGIVYAYSSADDAVNSAGDFTVTGGFLCGHSTANDGLDANGNFYIKGGVVYAIGKSSPEVAVDANTEGGKKLYLSGGTIIAIGGLENGSSLTQSCYQASSWSKNTWYGLTIGSTVYAFKTPSSGGSGLVVSGASQPTLSSGVTVSGGDSIFNGTFICGASLSGGTSVSLTSYTGGSGGPGGGGPGGGGRPW